MFFIFTFLFLISAQWQDDSLNLSDKMVGDEISLYQTDEKLIRANEEMIFSFQTQKHKEVVVVRDTNDMYVKYRYGRDGNIELEFPRENTKNSWSKFRYNSYWRGGGKANSGMEIDNLSFTNDGYEYLIYRTYFSETEEYAVGIIITTPEKKKIRIHGNPKTIQGCICRFEDFDFMPKNVDGDLIF